MNKEQFISELKRELKAKNVEEAEEIIAEYEAHFAFKAEEGKTEEETAKRLSSPEEIAREYASGEVVAPQNKGIKRAGVFAVSVPLACVYVLLWCAVIVLGAAALCFLTLGGCLILRLNIASLIPEMPYVSAFFMGIASFCFATLCTAGVIYLFLYVRQWGKVYTRWCKNVVNGHIFPSLSLHPSVRKKFAYKIKLTVMIAVAGLIVAFSAGYVSLCIAAGSFEPWHVYDWFV